MDKLLHIIALDIPYPANYGGVIDTFYTLKMFHKLGVQIKLHCFTSGRAEQTELNKYCQSVHYYPRIKNSSSFSFNTPLIVNSRTNELLLANLLQDDHPILFEGIHSTRYLQQVLLNGRKLVVRAQNAEYEYYQRLAKLEKNLFKRLYFLHESRLLKKYEKTLAAIAVILTLSRQDEDIFRNKLQAPNVHFVPALQPFTTCSTAEGKGCFYLYHGNLSVNENEKAATWLLENVFNDADIPFVIAGKNPSARLKKLAHNRQNVCLVENPSDTEMQDMIAKAHVHILPSFNSTGIKFKLLHAFFSGRHCLVNPAGVAGSGLEPYCYIAESADSFKQKIQELYNLPFSQKEIEQRQQLLDTIYNNETNAKKLMTFFW